MHPALRGPWEQLETKEMLIVMVVGAVDSIGAQVDILLNQTKNVKSIAHTFSPDLVPQIGEVVGETFNNTLQFWLPVVTWVKLAAKNVNGMLAGTARGQDIPTLRMAYSKPLQEVSNLVAKLGSAAEIFFSDKEMPQLKTLAAGMSELLQTVDTFTQEWSDAYDELATGIHQEVDSVESLAMRFRAGDVIETPGNDTSNEASGTLPPSPLEAEELADQAKRVKEHTKDITTATKGVSWKMYRATWQMESAVRDIAAKL